MKYNETIMVKICTFNVNSIRSRIELVKSWLEKRSYDLDIICFQEIKTVEDTFPFSEFEKIGYNCHVSGQKSYNGVAICTKSKTGQTTKEFNSVILDTQKRILLFDTGSYKIINVYAPHGGLPGEDKYEFKQSWYGTFLKYLNNNFSPEDKIIILGDLNIAHKDQDVYDPKLMKGAVGTMPEERKLFDEILSWGFYDSFRHLNPDKQEFTWWDYSTAAIWRNEGMRIDYVLVTKPMLKQCKSVETDIWPRKRRTPTPSDHAPVVLTLQDCAGC